MKIVQLTAENIKKLIAVEIRPDGNMIQIKGKNGAGKSSVLDAIYWALAGTSNIQERPIRKGQESARIRLDLGDIIVTRVFRPGKDGGTTSSLSVQSADGAKYPSPQSMLDALLGQLSFDPLAFARMEPRKQFDILKSFVPGIDFAAIDAANRHDYSARTDLNRMAREERILADGIIIPENAPHEVVDESALVDSLAEAGKYNADIELRKSNRESAVQKIRELESRIGELRKQAEALDEEARRLEEKLAAAPPLADPIDTFALRQRISQAKETNRLVRLAREKAAHLASAKEHEDRAAILTRDMEQREADKLTAIASAKLPVENLSFGDGEILLNDLPFAQASDAEQLRVSLAIAMALNPLLRVLRVRDGSLLDEDSMRLIESMVTENDYQLWIERVDGSGTVGIVLEDGHLKDREWDNADTMGEDA